MFDVNDPEHQEFRAVIEELVKAHEASLTTRRAPHQSVIATVHARLRGERTRLGNSDYGMGAVMGIKRTEDYVCDTCGRRISPDGVYVGQLAVRKLGARGAAVQLTLTMHRACIPTVRMEVSAEANGKAPRRRRAAASA